MKDISLKDMLANAVHFGHRTQKWNPKMKKYIYSSNKGIHIFDLKKTAENLKTALDYIEQLSNQGRNILLVGTKPQATKLLLDTANKTKMPVVTNKWICGLLTNYSTIKARIKYLKDIKQMIETGEIEKYTKKEQMRFKREMEKLLLSLGGVEDMERMPDALFVVDVVKDRIAVREARRMHIPVIAIVDTNGDPDLVDYVIPGNDGALKSLTYIIGYVRDAILEGKNVKK